MIMLNLCFIMKKKPFCTKIKDENKVNESTSKHNPKKKTKANKQRK